MKVSRRDLLKRSLQFSGATLLGACGGHERSVARAPVAQPARTTTPQKLAPHYVVFIHLNGGVDSVLTYNGLDASKATGNIDVSYRADERIAGKERFFGPLISELARHDDSLCFVHGVRHDTVSHSEGESMLTAGKRHFGSNSPPFLGMLAAALPQGPELEAVVFSPSIRAESTGGTPGALELDSFTNESLLRPDGVGFPRPAWFEQLTKVQGAELKVRLQSDEQAAQVIAQMDQADVAHRFLAKVDRVSRMRSPYYGPMLDLIADGVAANLSKTYFLSGVPDWCDTHSDNDRRNHDRLPPLMNDLAVFIDRLKEGRNEFGPLFEQTTVVVASEIGRYPKFNKAGGRDHWPEVTWLLAGRGVRGGVSVGATDEQFRGMPVNMRTGATKGPDLQPIFLENVFATVAAIARANPSQMGYAADSVMSCIQTA